MNVSPSKTIVPRDELAYNVKDLLVYCFQHWRSALVLLLAGGLLFGLLSGVSAYQSELSNRELLSHSLEDYLAMADDTSLNVGNSSYLEALHQSDTVAAIDQKSAQLTYDIDHSLLMQIDPTAVAVATATVVVLPADRDDLTAAGNLLLAYRSALLNGAYLGDLAKTLSTKSEYLRELITVSISGESAVADGSGNSISLDSLKIRDRLRAYNGYIFPFSIESVDEAPAVPSSVIELRVIAAEPGLAGQLMDAILAELDTLLPQMRQRVALHTIAVLNRTLSVESDSALIDTQMERRMTLTDLAGLRNQHTSILSQMNFPTVSSGSAKSVAFKAGVKRGVIAAIGLFLAYGLLLCLRYLFSDRPLTEIRFRQHYRLLPLAAFRSAPSAVYRCRTPFDRWLRRCDRMVEESESSAVYDLAAGNLQLYAGRLSTVLISGSVSTEDKLALASALAERLSGTKYIVASDLIDIHERLKLAEADGVIFYESYDATRFPTLNEELELTERAGVRVLGSVFQ